MDAQGWQPIETAPKDGTPVLVHAPGGCTQWKLHTTLWICRWDGRWVEAGGEEYTTCEPTHWMPLPPPPDKDL